MSRRTILLSVIEEKITMYHFYIVRCSDDSLYCGQTNNLQRRINEHNFDKNKSSRYLRAKKPVKLVYSEEYPTLQLAMKREWQVKKWTRTKKEALINGDIVFQLSEYAIKNDNFELLSPN